MRLIYLDESGIGNLNDERHVVVAGVIINPDRDHIPIEDALFGLAIKYIPPKKLQNFLVFHATDLFNGTGKTFGKPDKWPIERTLPMIRGIIRTIFAAQFADHLWNV